MEDEKVDVVEITMLLRVLMPYSLKDIQGQVSKLNTSD